MNKPFKLFLIIALCIIVFNFVSAEEVDQAGTKERKEELQRQLSSLEGQINTYRAIIEEKQGESASLERDIAILNAKINKAKLEIKRLDMEIAETTGGISKRVGGIKFLSEKIVKEKESLSELIRKNSELDSASILETALGYKKFSDFFVIADSFESVHGSIQSLLEEIRGEQKQLAKEKENLEERKIEQTRLKEAQDKERKKLAANETEKKNILKITKGVEKGYQAIMALRQKDAAKIRSQLFLLNGSPSISFEKAVEYANIVWKMLGVRPAFLLGVIREESNLGANVGKGNWKNDLSHSKCASQRSAFVRITSELGLDPDLMPVSKKQNYGYCGGAMGPAQFMPVTWEGIKKRIVKAGGNNPPDPWNPKDAFIASGLYLNDLGADLGTKEAERKAALRYLAGSNWNKPSVRFYGDDVMEFAAEYQEQIDIINKNIAKN